MIGSFVAFSLSPLSLLLFSFATLLLSLLFFPSFAVWFVVVFGCGVFMCLSIKIGFHVVGNLDPSSLVLRLSTCFSIYLFGILLALPGLFVPWAFLTSR